MNNNYHHIRVLSYLFLFLWSSNTFSNERLNSYGIDLSPCENFQQEKIEYLGVIEWMNSIDSVDKCDTDTITFLSSQRSVSSINSNLAMLKLHYNFCSEVIQFAALAKQKLEDLNKKKSLLNNCLPSSANTLLERSFSHVVVPELTNVYEHITGKSINTLNEGHPLLLIARLKTWGQFIYYIDNERYIGWLELNKLKEK